MIIDDNDMLWRYSRPAGWWCAGCSQPVYRFDDPQRARGWRTIDCCATGGREARLLPIFEIIPPELRPKTDPPRTERTR